MNEDSNMKHIDFVIEYNDFVVAPF